MQQTLGLYNVTPEYLCFLHGKDNRVQYDSNNNYERKPFLGSLILGGEEYFIPLSSPKERKCLNWDYVGDMDFVLHETITPQELRPDDVIKEYYPDGRMEKILAILNINNMIPVPAMCRKQITIPQRHYSLLRKEYQFCLGIQSQIITKANEIYSDQTAKGIFAQECCDFKKLEDAKNSYNIPA